jgi:rhamnose utilization protein RhaD (predicted bifunctional aldolase and dehydrogenase)
VSDGFGGHHHVKEPWLDVSVPFVGDADSFRIASSNCSIPDRRVRIGQNQLVISVRDDDGADAAIETFKSIVSGNLRTLQSEARQMKSQLEQAIRQAADRRRAEVDAQDERDKSRSFRVIN